MLSFASLKLSKYIYIYICMHKIMVRSTSWIILYLSLCADTVKTLFYINMVHGSLLLIQLCCEHNLDNIYMHA